MKLNPRNIILILSILLFLIFLLYIYYPPVTNIINKTLDPNFPLNKTMTGTIWGLLVVIFIGAFISVSLTDFKKGKEKNSNLDELVKERLLKELNDKDNTLKEHKLTIEQKERQFIELFKKYKELDKNISLDKNDIKIKEALNSANFEKAEELLLLDLKNQDIKKSKTYINLGDVSYIKQDFAQAILYYERALLLDKTNQDCKFNIAVCYGQIGNYTKKIDILLGIKKENLYVKEKEYLFLGNLANAYLPLDSKETIEYGLKALESYNKLGIEDNYFRMILNLDLSNAYYQIGDYPTSLTYDKKALQIHNKYYNDDDSMIANIYSRRGSTYNQLGKYKVSLKYNKKVLDIRKNKYGENSLATAASYSNIGSTYSNLGDNEKAIEYTQKALNIVNNAEYSKFDIAQYNANIGYYYLKLEKEKESIEYLKKALKLRKELFDEDNIYIASNYMNLGDAYSLNGDHDKALDYLKKSLEIRKRILPQDHSDIASSYSNLGGVYARKGFFDDAIESYKKAYEIFKNKLGENHSDTLITYFNIGSLLFQKEEYKESISYIAIAERGLLKSLNANHPYLINCYQMFASLYMEVGDVNKAKEYLEKLESMNKLEKKELLGLVYTSIGMETNSKEYLEKAAKLIPNIPLYEEILKEIDELSKTC